MRRLKRTANFSLSSYTKEVSYQIFQIVKSYLLKLYIEPKETKFELENVFSHISPGIFYLSSGIRVGLQKKLNLEFEKIQKTLNRRQ